MKRGRAGERERGKRGAKFCFGKEEREVFEIKCLVEIVAKIQRAALIIMKMMGYCGRVVKAVHSKCTGVILAGSNPVNTVIFFFASRAHATGGGLSPLLNFFCQDFLCCFFGLKEGRIFVLLVPLDVGVRRLLRVLPFVRPSGLDI